MYKEGFITNKERETASKQPIRLSKIADSSSESTAYYVEYVRKHLINTYGSEQLYKGGMNVHIAMDLDYQIAAHEALQAGILNLSRRQGYRGPLERLERELEGGKAPQQQIDKITHKNNMLLGNVVKGVVVNVQEQHAIISLGKERGILEWEHLKSWKTLKTAEHETPVQITQISDVLAEGDVIQVILDDFDMEQQMFRLQLHQEPKVNGAILALDPKTGHVLAMSGGYNYNKSQFNRAVQAKRQPGSAFKPVVYSAAIDSGYTLSDILVDSPLTYKEMSEKLGIEEIWNPQNYAGKIYGRVSLRNALIKSLNIPTIRLVEDLTPKNIIEYSRKLGITSPMNKNLTIALGSHSSTLQETVTSYTPFANQGKLVHPIYIIRVEDRDGNILEETEPYEEQAISEETAFLMTDMMRDVVEIGTGQRAKAIGRPSAGKTGTTDNFKDAWYIGYIPQLLAGVYVGFDTPRSMGDDESGSRAAAPIWVDFMKKATNNLRTQRFIQPPNIIQVKMHNSGRRASSCDSTKETFSEFFKSGTEPPIDYQQDICVSQQETDDRFSPDLPEL